MTLLLNPQTAQEILYNDAHKTTHSTTERTFGILKRRFHCLNTELRMKPKKVCRIVDACVVLHNIAQMRNEANFDDFIPDEH